MAILSQILNLILTQVLLLMSVQHLTRSHHAPMFKLIIRPSNMVIYAYPSTIDQTATLIFRLVTSLGLQWTLMVGSLNLLSVVFFLRKVTHLAINMGNLQPINKLALADKIVKIAADGAGLPVTPSSGSLTRLWLGACLKIFLLTILPMIMATIMMVAATMVVAIKSMIHLLIGLLTLRLLGSATVTTYMIKIAGPTVLLVDGRHRLMIPVPGPLTMLCVGVRRRRHSFGVLAAAA